MGNLIRKELLGEKNWIIGLCGFVVGINLLFLPLAEKTHGFSVIAVILLTIPAFPLMALVRSFLIWKNEWDQRNSFLLLSLPVRGYKVVLSKFGALTVEISLYLLLGILLPYLTFKGFSSDGFDFLFTTFLKIWLFEVFIILFIVPFPFFSYLLGRVFSRFSGWVTTGGLLGLLFIFPRYLHFGRKIFSFLPEVSLTFIINGEIETVSFNIASLAATFLFGLALLWASSFFIEKAEL